ncbi:MAG: hypothetical protein M3Q10_03445 [Chloroflexota bacterium]|nr:hypothetical protein [Chloroflexota bacterium]
MVRAYLVLHVQRGVPGQLDYPPVAVGANMVFDLDGTPSPFGKQRSDRR